MSQKKMNKYKKKVHSYDKYRASEIFFSNLERNEAFLRRRVRGVSSVFLKLSWWEPEEKFDSSREPEEERRDLYALSSSALGGFDFLTFSIDFVR